MKNMKGNICLSVSLNSSGKISCPDVRVSSFSGWPYYKQHMNQSKPNWLEVRFESVLKLVQKSSQIWNLCSGIRSRFFWLFTLCILWSLVANLKIRRPVKNTDWKTLTGRLSLRNFVLTVWSRANLSMYQRLNQRKQGK